MTAGTTYDMHVRWMSPHASAEALLYGKTWPRAIVAQRMRTQYVAIVVRIPAVIMDNERKCPLHRHSSMLVRSNETGEGQT